MNYYSLLELSANKKHDFNVMRERERERDFNVLLQALPTIRYAGVIRFVFHLLQLLMIIST